MPGDIQISERRLIDKATKYAFRWTNPDQIHKLPGSIAFTWEQLLALLQEVMEEPAKNAKFDDGKTFAEKIAAIRNAISTCNANPVAVRRVIAVAALEAYLEEFLPTEPEPKVSVRQYCEEEKWHDEMIEWEKWSERMDARANLVSVIKSLQP